MENFESPAGRSKSGAIVIGLVVVGLLLVAVGGYLVWSKKQGGSSTGGGASVDEAEFKSWCELRQEWAKQADPLAGDILLKSVRPQDADEREQMVVKRNMLCQEFARKLRDLKITDPVLGEVELALVKEGKMRANISIEIENFLAKIESPDVAGLRAAREKLDSYIQARIAQGKGNGTREIDAALGKLADVTCPAIYRGPMTDAGTTGNPYVSWDELELKRTQALKIFDDKIKELEPVEQYTNRVYHELVRKYRPIIKGCYTKAKAKNPQMSDKLGLRVRLKADGKVATLGIEWMENRDEKILDCMLQSASRWRLPQPDPEMLVVVVTIDFAAF